MKKIICSVADVFAYDSSDNLVFEGKTMLNTSMENALSSTPVKGGKGNSLLFNYYHSGELTGSIENVQWSMEQMALNVGSTIGTGSNIWTEETVTVASGVGTIVGTPVAFQTSTIYAWVTYGDIESERVTVDGSNEFTIADTSYTGDLCVSYLEYSAATRYLTISANIIPSVFRLVMRADIYTDETMTTKAGEVIITVDKAQATGAFTMAMTSDGTSTTPLNYTALTSRATATGCGTGVNKYGTIQEYLIDANWYDSVVALAVAGGNFELEESATVIPTIYAVPSTGDAFIPPYADLSFAATGGTTVDNTTATTRGTITGGGTAGTVVVTITSKTSVELTIAVSVPA